MRDNETRRPAPQAEADGLIEGRNAVIEALRAGTAIDKIYLAKGETDKTLGHIASRAREAGVVVVEADRRKLDAMSRTHSHQGVIALAAVREYVSVQSILDAAAAKGEPLCGWCATRYPTPTTWGPSSAPPSAPGPTGSSSPSAAPPGSPPLWGKPPPGPSAICRWPGWPT